MSIINYVRWPLLLCTWVIKNYGLLHWIWYEYEYDIKLWPFSNSIIKSNIEYLKPFQNFHTIIEQITSWEKWQGWACLFIIWKNKEHLFDVWTQKQSWLCKSPRRLTHRNSAIAALYAQEAYMAQFCENACLHKFWNLIIMP